MEKKLSALILDDEPYCSETLFILVQKYCPQISDLHHLNDPEIALEYLQNKSVDILFLDIEMPHLNGFDFLEKVVHFKGLVIFTTAYNEYAIKAFKVNAIAYLLKPIDKGELQEAVQKATERKILSDQRELILSLKSAIGPVEPEDKKIPIHTAEGIHLIPEKDIVRCESEGSYSHIVIQSQKKLLVSKNLRELSDLFNSEKFLRIHKSHLINLDHISLVSRQEGGGVIMSDGFTAPISRSIKKDFYARF